MGKSLMHDSRKLLLFCMLFYIAIARAEAVAEANTPLIGILSGSNDEYIIKKSHGWQLEAIDHATYLGLKWRKPANVCSFNASTIDALNVCLYRKVCSSDLALKALSFDGDACEAKTENSPLRVQKLTPDVYFVEGYSFKGMLLDVNTGKPLHTTFPTHLTVDVKNNQIVFAQCKENFENPECELFEKDLNGQNFHSLMKLKYSIADLFLKNGILYALVSKGNLKFHTLSFLLNWSGHGAYYRDWFMLEIVMADKQVSEFPLIKNLRDSVASFPNKWEPQVVQ